jgi:hypothetical protein
MKALTRTDDCYYQSWWRLWPAQMTVTISPDEGFDPHRWLLLSVLIKALTRTDDCYYQSWWRLWPAQMTVTISPDEGFDPHRWLLLSVLMKALTRTDDCYYTDTRLRWRFRVLVYRGPGNHMRSLLDHDDVLRSFKTTVVFHLLTIHTWSLQFTSMAHD